MSVYKFAEGMNPDLIDIGAVAKQLRMDAEREIRRLNEELSEELIPSWMSFSDLADTVRFPGDGTDPANLAFGNFNFQTAFSMAFVRPTDTATAYVNEAMRRMIVAASRAFCRLNPYWMSVKNARIAYNVGDGHIYSIIAREAGEEVDKTLAKQCMKELNRFLKENHYRAVQNERLTRGDRDGEYFLRYYTDDEVLGVEFVEPIAIQTPTSMSSVSDNVWFGIQFYGERYSKPVGYYVKPLTPDGTDLSPVQVSAWETMIPADEIQRRTFNVDRSSPRGVPTTYALRGPLTQALATGVSMAKQAEIRTRIAMISKQVNATLGQITPLLQRNRAGTVTGAGGVTLNAFRLEPGTILHTNDQRNYEFPSPHLETDKVVFSVRNDLQIAAAAVGFADFVLNGDSTSNFAGALVKKGPMDKSVGATQADLIEDDKDTLERALRHAVDQGRLPEDTLDKIAVHAEPPQAVDSRIQDAQADEIYVRNGACSTETMCVRGGFDPDVEMPRIKSNPPPAVLAIQQKAASANGDQRSSQPSANSKPTARGVPAGQEPGAKVNPNKIGEELEESAHNKQSAEMPTQEDVSMASRIITPEWLAQVRGELLALPQAADPPRNWGAKAEYEPGVMGVRLGMVDSQEVWAVDMDALCYKHDMPDLACAANSQEWEAVPRDKIVVDWSMAPTEVAHLALHEIVEQRLLESGWSHARAHRYAGRGPGCERDFLLACRPELQTLRGDESRS